MRYFGNFLLCLFLFSSCLSDEERRLQTDQSYEGEEMFNISFSLDEHAFFAFRPFGFYQDTVNHSTLPGCPMISINAEERTVSLSFGEGDCETDRPLRTGLLTLTYLDSLPNKGGMIRIGYDNYSTRGIRVEGMRFIHANDTISSGVVFQDHLMDFLIRDANNSSSKLNGSFTHEVLFSSDTIQHITIKGGETGRNLAGRSFEMEITQPKQLQGDCLRKGYFVAESGQESWTIERTVGPEVRHLVNYQQAPDCANQANIQLFDGGELKKAQ